MWCQHPFDVCKSSDRGGGGGAGVPRHSPTSSIYIFILIYCNLIIKLSWKSSNNKCSIAMFEKVLAVNNHNLFEIHHFSSMLISG